MLYEVITPDSAGDRVADSAVGRSDQPLRLDHPARITSYNVCYTKLLRVLEMGMSARGEIARLTEIAEPFVGVVTNVGPAPLESLLNLDGVMRAKGELFAAMKPGSIAVVNTDDERVVQLPVANGVRRITFGLNDRAEVRASDVVAKKQRIGFDLLLPKGLRPVWLNVAGRHNVHNALAAAAAAGALEVDEDLIVQGLEAFRPTLGRMELIAIKNDILILEDSYNANPLSVKAALSTLDVV